jgi:hypothetical protein
MAKVFVSDTAVATPGDYEKFFMYQGKRYHHIFNPREGFPTEGCQSVTIIHKDGMTADALATAVFVLGPEKGYSLSKARGCGLPHCGQRGKDHHLTWPKRPNLVHSLIFAQFQFLSTLFSKLVEFD